MADNAQLKNIVEAALLAAGKPLDLDHIQGLFEEDEQPEKKHLREVLKELADDYEGRGIEISEVASGWRIQVRTDYSRWVSRLWEEKPGRYSRALMETLALIAYRQPITRGEIEEIRGVSVSSNITKTLLERDWVRVVGQRDVPGKPSLYGTTRDFLDYFNLKSLDDLPTLAEIRDLDEINRTLDLEDPDRPKDEAQAAEEPEGEGAELIADAGGLAEAAESALASEAPAADQPDTDAEQDPMAVIRDELTKDAFDDELPALDAEAMGEVAGEADADRDDDTDRQHD
jgi:segregation and condensation protein B